MTRRSLKILPTTYNGVTFRSRTEARWAVLFEVLGADATYEPESYNLDGAWYLPDFFVHSWNMFVEIKGEIPTPFQRARCRKLADTAKRPVFLISGAPGARTGHLFIPDDEIQYFAALTECRGCSGPTIEYWYADAHFDGYGALLIGGPHNTDRCGEKFGGERWFPAVAQARDERFGIYPKGAA